MLGGHPGSRDPRRGGRISASDIGDIRRALLDSVVGGPGILVNHVGNKITITLARDRILGRGGGGGGSELEFFVVDEIGDDYLLCHAGIYGTPLGDLPQVSIAKPFMLMHAPFIGETITYWNGNEIYYAYGDEQTRVAYLDHGEETEIEETQIITPNYFIGEEIRAAFGSLGDVWQDVNTAGRAWAAEPQ